MRYIILFGNIFSERDWVRFGCDTFARRGYEIVPVELLSFIKPGQKEKSARSGFLSIDNGIQIHTEAELENLISGVRPDDLVLNVLSFSDQTAPVYWLLKKYAVDYAAFSLGKIPLGWFRHYASACSFSEYVGFKFTDFVSIAYRAKMLLGFMTKEKYRWKDIQPPRWWLDAGAHYDMFDVAPVKRSQAQRIAVHSLDIETATQTPDVVNENLATPRKPYAVFLDDGFFGYPDFTYHDIDVPVSPAAYARSLSRLFDAIERKFGYDVIIAQHPKSEVEAIRKCLGERPIVCGETGALTRDCELVISHCSTSISYAVLYRKPILYVTTDELEQSSFFKPMIVRMSSWLRSRRVNLDDPNAVEALVHPVVDEGVYQAYESAFLREPEVHIRSIWTELMHLFERGLKPVPLNREKQGVGV